MNDDEAFNKLYERRRREFWEAMDRMRRTAIDRMFLEGIPRRPASEVVDELLRSMTEKR